MDADTSCASDIVRPQVLSNCDRAYDRFHVFVAISPCVFSICSAATVFNVWFRAPIRAALDGKLPTSRDRLSTDPVSHLASLVYFSQIRTSYPRHRRPRASTSQNRKSAAAARNAFARRCEGWARLVCACMTDSKEVPALWTLPGCIAHPRVAGGRQMACFDGMLSCSNHHAGCCSIGAAGMGSSRPQMYLYSNDHAIWDLLYQLAWHTLDHGAVFT